jgi:hypothetical protein
MNAFRPTFVQKDLENFLSEDDVDPDNYFPEADVDLNGVDLENYFPNADVDVEDDEDDDFQPASVLNGRNRILNVDSVKQAFSNTVCGLCAREEPPLISTLDITEETFGIATELYSCCSVQEHDPTRKPHYFKVKADRVHSSIIRLRLEGFPDHR